MSKTNVFFVIDSNFEEVTAVFPNEKENGNNVMCYAHIGQHSACSPEWIAEQLPATEKEYNDLKNELTNQIGYDLQIVAAPLCRQTIVHLNETTDVRNIFVCSQCGCRKTYISKHTTGYGKDKNDNIICYDCIGKNDFKELDSMQPGAKTVHYWDGKHIINWPGTMRINPTFFKKGKHNIAGSREDVWFRYNGKEFHGVNYGTMSQILHISRVKA